MHSRFRTLTLAFAFAQHRQVEAASIAPLVCSRANFYALLAFFPRDNAISPRAERILSMLQGGTEAPFIFKMTPYLAVYDEVNANNRGVACWSDAELASLLCKKMANLISLTVHCEDGGVTGDFVQQIVDAQAPCLRTLTKLRFFETPAIKLDKILPLLESDAVTPLLRLDILDTFSSVYLKDKYEGMRPGDEANLRIVDTLLSIVDNATGLWRHHMTHRALFLLADMVWSPTNVALRSPELARKMIARCEDCLDLGEPGAEKGLIAAPFEADVDRAVVSLVSELTQNTESVHVVIEETDIVKGVNLGMYRKMRDRSWRNPVEKSTSVQLKRHAISLFNSAGLNHDVITYLLHHAKKGSQIVAAVSVPERLCGIPGGVDGIDLMIDGVARLAEIVVSMRIKPERDASSATVNDKYLICVEDISTRIAQSVADSGARSVLRRYYPRISRTFVAVAASLIRTALFPDIDTSLPGKSAMAALSTEARERLRQMCVSHRVVVNVIAALAQVAARCMGTSARPLPDDLVAAAVAAAAADGDEADLATLTLDLDHKDCVGRLQAAADVLSIPDLDMVFGVVLRIHLNQESGSNWARWFTDHLGKGLGDVREATVALEQQQAQQLLTDSSDHADALRHAQELLDAVHTGMRRLWFGDKHNIAEFVVGMAPTHAGAQNILGSLAFMFPSELALLSRRLETAAQQPPPPPPPPFGWAPPAAANNNNDDDDDGSSGPDWRATAEQLRVENTAQALHISQLQQRVADLERQLAEARGKKTAAADAADGEDEEWVDETDDDDDS